ncbi:hypothetical protein ACOXXX_17710 [Thalassococcus sp. BH17M4-6]|uniref:hypothetical protein n=1 Tax=Thalassococcus sp. BH17M4-6 TaxID=3413148 RepID=UPI003BE629E9
MTTTDAQLIKLFEDGKLPTGANFRDLILSKVNVADFDDLKAEIDAWEHRTDVQIGPDGAGWDLLLGGPGQLDFAPNDGNAVPAAQATVDLYGWSRAFGRIGRVEGAKAFAAETPDLDLDTLQSVGSDGRWKVLMDMPGRVAAFEVTAATAYPVERKTRGVGDVLRWLVGYISPANAVVRVTATATGLDAEPRLSCQTTTTASRMTARFGALVVGALILAALVTSGVVSDLWQALPTGAEDGVWETLKGLPSQIANTPFVSSGAFWLALGYFIRSFVQMVSAQHNGLRLRWKSEGGSWFRANRTWRLEVKGPDLGKNGEARLYYHITAFWG